MGCFSALLFGAALLLSGCGAHETPEPAAAAPSAAFTRKSSLDEVKNDPAFRAFGRLLFPTDGYYYSHIDPDETVEIANTLKERAGIDTECHVYPGLGHGFGPGTGTAAGGWLDDAAAFWEKQMPP